MNINELVKELGGLGAGLGLSPGANVVSAGGGGGGPAFSFKVGTFQSPTGTGAQDQSVTGVGFQPKALILIGNALDTLSTQTAHMQHFVGYSDGTNHRCINITSEDNVATTVSKHYADTGAILQHKNNDGTAVADAYLDSFDSDGFTIHYDSQTSTTAYYVNYIAIGGTSVSAEVGSFDSPASATPQSQSVATSVANADFAFFMSAGATSEDSSQSEAQLVLGMTTGPSNEGLVGLVSQDGVGTTQCETHQTTDSCIGSLNPADGEFVEEADFTNFTGSGFDINWSLTNATAHKYYYLIIKGGQWEVGTDTTPAVTGDHAVTTSFEPKGMMNILRGEAFLDDRQHFRHGFGAMSESDSFAHGLVDVDAVATSNNSRYINNSKCYFNPNGVTTTLEEGDPATTRFNATDFTINFTKINSSARYFLWCACGDA